jgi:CheY-like chemotaxis protein
VLLCEDNQVNQAIAKRILTSFGLDVDIASNGVEGVDAFKASKPGDYLAILMDIQMPFMNGYEATMKIRSLRRADAKKIPIIAMTADAFKAALEKSKAAGMSDYLTKPLDPKKIREVLASIKA